MGRWVESLAGLEVRVTGDFRRTALRMTQTELEHDLRARGAIVVADIRRTTDLLIRAESALWKYGDFGDREAELASYRERGGDGLVIEVSDLLALFEGLSAWAREPLAPPPEQTSVGASYRTAAPVSDLTFALFERDPAALERALLGHARTQNLLADFLNQRGIEALSPTTPSIQFDVAWEFADAVWVAEVKSLSGQNEAIQLRLGLGQVLDYAWRLAERHQRPVRAVIVAERSPDDPDWMRICAAAGVVLTFPPFRELDRCLATETH